MKTNNTKNESLVLSSEAIKLVSEEFNIRVTRHTLRNWCIEHDIGKKIVGRWYVDMNKLKDLLRNK